jgi:hypothetical protein
MVLDMTVCCAAWRACLVPDSFSQQLEKKLGYFQDFFLHQGAWDAVLFFLRRAIEM